MTKEIKFKNHFNHLLPYFVFTLVIFIIFVYDYYYNSVRNNIIYIVYVGFIIQTIIHFYLYLKYYILNKGVKLYISDDAKTIRYVKKIRKNL